MKQFKVLILAFGMMLALVGCAGNKAPESGEGAAPSISQTQKTEEEQAIASEDGMDSKNEGISQILVAYFSRADENYGVGVIEKGNTEILAEMIAEETGGELFHIERDTPYPAEYRACTDEAKQEQNDNARPALLTDTDISGYDVIFLGYPNWWGDLPMPVYTFLEGHDWNGKIVIPFCTHAGSGLSGTVKSIENTCAGATVLDGLAVAGVTAQNEQDKAKEAALDWLGGLQY